MGWIGEPSELAVKSKYRAGRSRRLRHSGEQLRERLDIASQNGHLIQNLRLHFDAEVRGRLFYQRGLGLHVDCLRQLANLKAAIHRDCGTGLYFYFGQLQGSESLSLETYGVHAGDQLSHGIESRVIGQRVRGHTRRCVGDLNPDFGNRRRLRVSNRSLNRSAVDGCLARAAEEERNTDDEKTYDRVDFSHGKSSWSKHRLDGIVSEESWKVKRAQELLTRRLTEPRTHFGETV